MTESETYKNTTNTTSSVLHTTDTDFSYFLINSQKMNTKGNIENI